MAIGNVNHVPPVCNVKHSFSSVPNLGDLPIILSTAHTTVLLVLIDRCQKRSTAIRMVSTAAVSQL